MLDLKSNIIKRSKQYFEGDKKNIAETNLKRLYETSIFGVLLAIINYLITPFFIKSWHITKEYIYIIPVFLLFGLFAHIYKKRTVKNYIVVQTACILFSYAVYAAFAVISLVPFPDIGDSFVGLWLILIPLLFIVNPVLETTISLIFSVIYAILLFKMKTPACAGTDAFHLVTYFCFSRVIIAMLYELRIREYKDKTKLIRLSQKDMLTKLYNKVSFENECKNALINANDDNSYNVYCIADIDNFKHINDCFGHIKGDDIIKSVGICLRMILGNNDIIGRIGGDEFAFLITSVPDIHTLKNTLITLNEEIQCITEMIITDKVSISIGGLILPNEPVEYNDIYRTTDKLLYETKLNGKSGFTLKKMSDFKTIDF